MAVSKSSERALSVATEPTVAAVSAARVAPRRRLPRSLGLVVPLALSGLVRIVHRRGVLGDVRDVEEPVALETDVDEGGLHPGEHLRYAAFVDVADDAALAFALDEELCDEIVFQDGDTRFVIVRGDDHLLGHAYSIYD